MKSRSTPPGLQSRIVKRIIPKAKSGPRSSAPSPKTDSPMPGGIPHIYKHVLYRSKRAAIRAMARDLTTVSAKDIASFIYPAYYIPDQSQEDPEQE